MIINKNLFSFLHNLLVRGRYLLRFGLLAILMGVLVVACQDSPKQKIVPQSSVTETGNCRVVEHEAGETEICGQPQIIAALSPRVLDHMLALDVQPAAYAEAVLLDLHKFDNPSQQIPVLGHLVTTQPINLGSVSSPSLETLVEVNPDLILGEIHHEYSYEVLSKIAPTLMINYEPDKEGRSRHLHAVAQALGKEKQVGQVIAEYEQQLAEVRVSLAPVIAAYPRILLVEASNLPNTFGIDSYFAPAGALLGEIGFELVLPDGLPREAHYSEASVEALVQLDPDIIIVSAWSEDNLYTPEIMVKQQWKANPLLQKMRAVQEGHIRFVSGKRLGQTTSGPISYKSMLDLLPELLLPFVKEE